MATKYATNVDCAQRYMNYLEDNMGEVNPLVGDRVVILEKRGFTVTMLVVSRVWRNNDLLIELTVPPTFSISSFEAFVKKAIG